MTRRNAPLLLPLQGGLGNQLFQLAAGLAAQARTGRPLCFSDFWLRHPEPGETPRQLAIAGLLLEGELTSQQFPRAGRATDRLTGRRVIERSPGDDALARLSSRTRVLAGYFQRLEYAQEAWPSLRERLAASDDPRQQRLIRTEPAAYGAVHYRLGDYVTNPHANTAHGVTSPGYFADAIRHGHRSLGIDRWVVVSDDPTAALALLRSTELPATVHLEVAAGDDEWADLATLASARVCAISNSSFSWWAAFIGSTAREMQVVAPRPWFSDPAQPEPPLFPATWERRERSLMSLTA